MDAPPVWLSESEAAEIIGCHRATLARLRIAGEGPPCYPIGQRHRYQRAEVEAWLAARRTSAPTAEPAA